MILVSGVLAFFITVLFMFALRPVAAGLGLVDLPGGRKRHGSPVPVIGGISMAVGVAFGANLVPQPEFWSPTILALYLLVSVGTIDDRFGLPASVRLIAQSCAAMLVVLGGELVVTSLGSPFFFALPLGPYERLFSILFIVVIINAFNVIDGIDGLAGGLAWLALAALAVIGYGGEVFALTTVLLAVIFGYLLFNFPLPFNRGVRTFMGDAGSTVLGLAVACVGIRLSQGADAPLSPSVGLWFVAVPVFDLFASTMRRVLARRSPFAPDHEHLHHVLIVEGLSPRATLYFMLLISFVCVGVGLVGHAAGAADGIMCVAWLMGGIVYYRAMRRPCAVVRLVVAFSGLARSIRVATEIRCRT